MKELKTIAEEILEKWKKEKRLKCLHCGAPNPDGHNRCGNCKEDPFKLPPFQAELTVDQIATQTAMGFMGLRRDENKISC